MMVDNCMYKARAAKLGIPYQRYIRQALESTVAQTTR